MIREVTLIKNIASMEGPLTQCSPFFYNTYVYNLFFYLRFVKDEFIIIVSIIL